MPEWLSRTELLLGKERLEKLQQAHVLVAGLGGVGAYAAEQLCRAGIGEMTIIDGDVVELTNKNRQLPALDCNLGKAKAEIMAGRFRNINPEIKLHVIIVCNWACLSSVRWGRGENWILRKLQWRTFRKVIIAIWRVCCVNACINWGFTKG